MSQPKKNKENTLFTIIVFLIIIIAIEITFLAITIYNENHPVIIEKKEEPEPIVNYFLTFSSLNPSKSIDIYQTYPENPLTITFAKSRVLIDGLKNSATEAKINEILKELDASPNDRDEHNCKVNFNVSNVLSLTCKNKSKNIDLTTGYEIKIEEIFNNDSDLPLILINSIYDTYCLSGGCNIDAPNNTMDFENEARKIIQKIKNQDYSFHLNNKEIYFDNLLLNNESVTIKFYDNLNDLTIYNRFLTTENIYEKDILEYCHPSTCKEKKANEYIETKLLNDNTTLINFLLKNETINDPENGEGMELNLKNIGPKILDELITKYIVPKENPQIINITANIYSHNSSNYRIKYQINTINTTAENYPKVILGYKDNTLSTETINNENILIDNEGNITYLE